MSDPTPRRPAIEVVCERIETLRDYRRVFAQKTKRGDLLMMYLEDETSGFSDAAISRHMDMIERCEALMDKEREIPAKQ